MIRLAALDSQIRRLCNGDEHTVPDLKAGVK